MLSKYKLSARKFAYMKALRVSMLVKLTTSFDFKILFLQMADGKPPNRFAFNARPRNKSFTMNVLNETHLQWKKMMMMTSSDGSMTSSNGSCLTFATECTQIESRSENIIGKYRTAYTLKGHNIFPG
jgi:hypothetical protein